MQRRNVLRRIEQSVRIERKFHGAHDLKLRRGELHAHLVDLLDAHAVLAGDGAAQRNAFLQHLGGKLLGAMQLVRVIGIEQDQRMQVAVAGVEHVRAAQAVLHLHRCDELQHFAQAFPGDGAVHAVVIGGNAPDRGKRRLPAGPEQQPFGLRSRDANRRRALLAQHRVHAADFRGDFFGVAVRLAQQQRLGLEVVAGVGELLHRPRRRLVHHFQPGRNDAGGNDAGHRIAGFFDVVERGHDAARGFRLGDESYADLGHHRQHAFAADHQRQQVVARRIQRLGTELHCVAGDAQAAHAHHVVHGEAVLEAMHAARVLGHIAADGAGDLRRRVRRVIQAIGSRRIGDGQVAHPRLHARDARSRIDRQYRFEARQRQQHTVAHGQRAPGQAGAGAARDHRHAHVMAGNQHLANLVLVGGQRHQHRPLAIRG